MVMITIVIVYENSPSEKLVSEFFIFIIFGPHNSFMKKPLLLCPINR